MCQPYKQISNDSQPTVDSKRLSEEVVHGVSGCRGNGLQAIKRIQGIEADLWVRETLQEQVGWVNLAGDTAMDQNEFKSSRSAVWLFSLRQKAGFLFPFQE